MDESTDKSPQTSSEDLATEYANNTFFQPTIWDLKILFGELSPLAKSIEWHTSITLPWAQAKIMAYYLELNVAAYELRQGPIKVPSQSLPQEPPPPPTKDPTDQALWELLKERRQKFLESLK
jgi:hypothetical protein